MKAIWSDYIVCIPAEESLHVSVGTELILRHALTPQSYFMKITEECHKLSKWYKITAARKSTAKLKLKQIDQMHEDDHKHLPLAPPPPDW